MNARVSSHTRGRGIALSVAPITLAVVAGCGASPGDGGRQTSQAVSAGQIFNFGTLVHPGSCMDAQGAGTGDGTQIQEWSCNGTAAQSFELQDAGNGAFTIVSTNANKCVDVSGSGTADGTKVQLWDCNGTGAQSFLLQPTGSSGFVNLVNTNSHKCLDVQSSNPTSGTVVQLWTCNGTNAQVWNPSVIGQGTSGGSSGGGGSSSGGAGSSGGGSGCDPSAWVSMSSDANACTGHLGEPCGWTASNEGQGYTCQTVSWGTGCEPNGQTCPGGGAGGGSGGGGSSGGGSSGGGGSGVAAILGESTFDSLFPNRNPIYSYQGLVQAAASYPAFATTGTPDDQKRELAAFLANVGHETGDLVYVEEIAKAAYCQPTAGCPCAAGQEYYGRGAMQLSWNYNYCAAGAALGQNLQASPELVATDPTLAWGTGVWFWMTSTGSVGQTCHAGIASNGFGETIQVINGGLECNGANPGEMQDRVQRYLSLCATLGVSPGANTGC